MAEEVTILQQTVTAADCNRIGIKGQLSYNRYIGYSDLQILIAVFVVTLVLQFAPATHEN